jgi:hypothetical protein
LTLTATTTVPCHKCHPNYATVTVILVGGPPNSSPGSAAGISAAGISAAGISTAGISAAGISAALFPSIAPSNQPPTNNAGSPNCPGCGSPANENVGAETMGIAANPPSSPASPSSAAQANAQGSTFGGGQNTVPAGSVTATSAPTNHGPYFTGGSERSLNILSQTIALGLMLAVVVGLAML